MFTSTSPKFDATVLLWGQTWWTPGEPEPVRFSSLYDAVARLIEARPHLAKNLRLIYEPEGFDTITTDCPNTNRRTLALTLAELHPALAAPSIAWSYEPILRRNDSFHTLLHLETSPALHQLVQSLAAAGYHVQQAWPLPTWLNMLPSDLTESGAVLAAALQPDTVCLYRQASDGVRSIERWHGSNALADFAEYLRAVFANNPAEPVWLVTAESDLIESLDALLPLDDKLAVEVLELTAVLGAHIGFPSRHPGQLLPPSPKITVSSFATAASVACLLTAAGLTGNYGWHYATGQRTAALRERQTAALRAEIEPLRVNAAIILRCQAQVAGRTVSLPVTAILAALGTDLPVEIALNRFVATTDGFKVSGGVSSGSTCFGPWLESLHLRHPGLSLVGGPPDTNGLFTLQGKSTP